MANVSGLDDLVDRASGLTAYLLVWWIEDGRCDAALKPWMFRADGRWPAPQEALDPYGIWIAEMILIPRSTPLSVWQLVVCVWPWSVMTQRV
ncbi:hypothetical protein PMIT1342_00017 [Prochlorococcus marinus str. MIT 1342]|nr:hypothetical protein PMIT1342_00017 [Prochlorococcus marinus str. MIT 1342]